MGDYDLLVKITGDASSLVSALGKASSNVSDFTKGIDKIGKGMTIVGGAITAAFALIIKKTVDAGDAFNDMSLRTGVSVESLSALAYAAKQSGTDIEAVELSLKFLTKAMDDTSKGTGTAKDTFKALGISVTDAEGKLRPTVEVMKDVATAVAAIDDPARQAAIAMELFGARSGTQLVPLLKLGESGIESLMQKAKDLGIVLSTEDAQAADNFKDKMNDLKEVLGAAARSLANVLIPSLTALSIKAVEFIKKIREWADEHKTLIEWIIKLGAGLGALAAVGGPIILAVNAFAKLHASMVLISTFSKTTFIPSIDAMGAKMIAFGATSGPVGIMTLAIVGLGIAWKLNLFGMKDDWDKTIKYIQDTSVKLLDGMKSMVSGLKDTLGGGGGSVGAFFGEPIKKEAIPAVIELTSYTEELTKKIENLSTSFELSQKYITENNKSMSDSIKYYSSMISLMNNLDSSLNGELSSLTAGTEEYKKKVEEIDKNTKALNEMKAALDNAFAPLTGIDLIEAKIALLGTTAEDNKTKLGYLGDESVLLKAKLDAAIPNTPEWWKWNDALAANTQSVKDLNQAIADSKLASLDAKLIYITGKFNEGKASVDGYHKQIWALEKELPLLQANLDKAVPESAEWYAAKTAVEEHKQAIKDLTIAMDALIAGKDPLKKSLEEEWDAWRKLTFGIKETEKEVDTFGSIMNTQFAGVTEQINTATVALSNFTKEGLAAAIVSTKMSFAPLLDDVKEMMAATKEMFMAGQLQAVDYNSLMIFYTRQLNEILKEMNEKISIFKSGYAEYQSMVGGTSGGSKKVSSYQEGTSYVPKTGLAIIHQGEKIIPAGQNTTSQSYAPIININNPVVRNDNDITKIRSEVNKALDEGKRQFLRRGSELALGM